MIQLPNQPAQPASNPGPGVQFSAGVVQGPDGRAWVIIQIIVGGMVTFTTTINDAGAAELAPQIGAVLQQAADTARQANLGIILPTNGTIPPPSNGRRPG
jgi:hypothetical protein